MCKNQADRAKTPRHAKRCPILAAYDRAEQKKSRKFALRTAVRSFPSSFRTVCKISGTARANELTKVRLLPNSCRHFVSVGFSRWSGGAQNMTGFSSKPFLFVRHGQVDWNERGLCVRQQDRALTPLGRAQAARAATSLCNVPLGGVFCSPLRRAYERRRSSHRIHATSPSRFLALARRLLASGRD